MIGRTTLCAAFIFAAATLLAQTETEPNDNLGQADTMSLGTAMSGDIGPVPCASGTSNDYFVLNITQDGQISVNTNASNSGTGTPALRIYMYNSVGSQVNYFDHVTGASGVPVGQTSNMSCVHKGIYYFLAYSLDGGVCYTYDLTVTVTAPVFADDLEPNNSFGDADANPLLAAA
ncbi:MAG: hypothetical protein JST38_13625, partial [Bacteroidetes bacterium]|nr:hypothetical protein [Bacteroidota bacterium]